LAEAALPVRHAAERRDADRIQGPNPHHTRPETHQNLIHPDKEQNHRTLPAPRPQGPDPSSANGTATRPRITP